MNETRLLYHGQEFEACVDQKNWHSDGVVRLASRPRSKPGFDAIVLHESVTNSREAVVNVLRRKKLGVHFIIDPEGGVTQHADPILDRCVHAGGWNTASVGIELVWPHSTKAAGKLWPDQPRIKAKWAHGGEYVVPPVEQLRSLHGLVEQLGVMRWGGVINHLGADHDRFRMKTWRRLGRRSGLVAHSLISGHADASFHALVLWLKAKLLIDVDEAYGMAIELSQNTSTWVGLPD